MAVPMLWLSAIAIATAQYSSPFAFDYYASFTGQPPAGSDGKTNSTTGSGGTASIVYSPLTPQQCGQIADANGFVPIVRLGNISQADLSKFYGGVCYSQICYYWKDKYSITDFNSLPASVPADVALSYKNGTIGCSAILTAGFNPEKTCDQIGNSFTTVQTIPEMVYYVYGQKGCSEQSVNTPPPAFNETTPPSFKFLSPQACGNMSKTLGLRPPDVKGNATQDQFVDWNLGMCNTQICYYWHDTYNMTSGVSWGSTPPDIKANYQAKEVACKAVIDNGFNGSLSCMDIYKKFSKTAWPTWVSYYFYFTCRPEVCRTWATQFNIVKKASWGNATLAVKDAWKAVGCTNVTF